MPNTTESVPFIPPFILPGYGPVIFVNRPVRTRTPGGVGAGGEPPRLPDYVSFFFAKSTIASTNLTSEVDFKPFPQADSKARAIVRGFFANPPGFP